MDDVSRLVVESPVGPLALSCRDGRLTEVVFCDRTEAPPAYPEAEAPPVLREAAEQLRAYFEGRLREFTLPLTLDGTAFQQRVWEQLQRIPYGRTETYGGIAARLGLPAGAARAVGLANGANPVSIVVPCHRVIGADGSLTGYGGGLDRKRFLLQLEDGQGTLFDEAARDAG